MMINMIKIIKIAIEKTTLKPMTTLELDLVVALVGAVVLDVLDVVLVVGPDVLDVVLMVGPDVLDVVLMVDPDVCDVILVVHSNVLDVVLMIGPVPVQANK